MNGPAYLAGSWADRPRLRGIRDELAAMGIACTARWLDYDGDALMCLGDLLMADTLLLFTEVPSTAGGMHVETGIAIGRNMPIIGVGPRTCLFHHLIADWYPAWPELRAALREIA